MDKDTLLNIRELLYDEDYKLDEKIQELRKEISINTIQKHLLKVELKELKKVQEGIGKAIDIVQSELDKCD